jgi:hypothetical protein
MSAVLWLPTIVAAAGSGMALWHWRQYALGEASRRWRRCDGRIVDLWFEEDEDTDGEAIVVFGDGQPDGYSAHLVYEYVVDGRRYRSRHFTYRPTHSRDARKVFGLLRSFRAGQKVEVRYDPKRPQRAVVLPGTDGGNLLRIGLWGLAALIALAVAIANPAWLCPSVRLHRPSHSATIAATAYHAHSAGWFASSNRVCA